MSIKRTRFQIKRESSFDVFECLEGFECGGNLKPCLVDFALGLGNEKIEV